MSDRASEAPEINDSKGPIFVVGNSRSGTTMMSRVLGRHPTVFTLGELHFFEQLWSPDDENHPISETEAAQLLSRLLCIQEDGYLNQGEPSRFYGEARELVSSLRLDASTPARLFEAFLSNEAKKNGKEIPCDQTPRNVFYIGEILDLYPKAQVISMIRDPRDVLLSQKRKWKRRFLGAKNIPLKEAFRSWVNYHPITISKLWNGSARAADNYAEHNQVHVLRFEDLVAEPENTVRKVCEFVGIPFDERLLEVPHIGSSSGLDSPKQKGISRDRAGSWRKGGLSSTEIFLCQKITGGLMREHGYTLSSSNLDLLPLGGSVVLFPIKLSLALLLNLKRMRNVKETIKRRLS
jgi:hypothetical protein